MKKLLSILILAVLSTFVWTSDVIEREFTVDGIPHFDLSNISGDINVMQGEDGRVLVKAVNPNPEIEVIFEQFGNRITVETKYPKFNRHIEGGVSFEVWLPQASDVKLNSVSGEISLASIEGRLDFNSVSGDIDAHDCAGTIKLNSVSGNIRIKSVNSTDLDINSVSGDIEVSQLTLREGRLKLNTVSGDAEVWLREESSCAVSGESLSGSMDVRGMDGLRVTKSKYVGNRNLSGSYNGGQADIDFSSVSGDFTIGIE